MAQKGKAKMQQDRNFDVWELVKQVEGQRDSAIASLRSILKHATCPYSKRVSRLAIQQFEAERKLSPDKIEHKRINLERDIDYEQTKQNSD